MKKLTLSIALVAGITLAKAQDTTCTMFQGKRVIEFNYQTSEVLQEKLQTSRYYDIVVEYGDVLCLHLYDDKNKTRKVIVTFFDGTTFEEILDSKENVYYSPRGTTKVSVSKTRFFNKL
tara:strand:+ start:238 stop:594 length:357 start_codon:yes stop_codon:yes gene_type:complete